MGGGAGVQASDVGVYELSFLLDFGFTSIIFGNVVNMLGFVSTAWAIPNLKRYNDQWSGLGLWKICIHDGKWNIVECKSIFEFDLPSWFRAVQAMITLAFLGQKAALVLIGLYGCVRRLQHHPIVVLIFTCVCFGSALLSSIGLIIFGAKVEEALSDENGTISWSFILEVVAVVFTTMAGVFGALEVMAVGIKYRHMGNIQRKVKTGPTDISTISQGTESKSPPKEGAAEPGVNPGNGVSTIADQARAMTAYDNPDINDKKISTNDGKMVTIDLQSSTVATKSDSNA